MVSFQFWKSWSLVYRWLLLVFSLVFVASLIFLLSSLIRNPAPVFTWQQLQELQHQELPIYTFEVGGFNFTISSDNYILFERWAGNPMHLNMISLDIYLIFFSIALIILLTIITVLKRFWFFVGAGLMIFLMSSLQWEALGIFDLENKLPTGVIISIFLGVCLAYQYFRITATFLERLIVFTTLFITLGFFISYFSNVNQPLRTLAVNSLPASMVMLIVFIVMVAHEIIAGFVSLVGRSHRRSKNLKNFLIISLVYLLNLWLAYWDRIGWLDWELTIAPILVLCISAVLAVWGIRQRQPLYETIISADPFAVYFILSLGTLALAVVGYFLASVHDLAILTSNDLILYTHIGYGMLFILYVGSNFLNMLLKSMPVHKVLYKPTYMPYFTYRFAGLIFTLAFVFYNTWMVPVNHFISTYYAAQGDLYESEGNSLLALGYYKRSHVLAPYNQHASTALAKLEGGNSEKASNYLSDANLFMPTEFTLMNYANAFHQSGKLLDEIIFLEQARKQLPKSSVIKNNLGLGFTRLGVNDSASYYFSEARKDPKMEATADMNLLGLIAKNNLKVNADSVYKLLHLQEDRVKSNALAIANQQGKLMEVTLELPKDSLLNLFSASLIGNYITNHLHHTDTSLLARCISLAQKPENKDFKEIILSSAARACYSIGHVNRAFQLLIELIAEGTNPGKHNMTLALWSLDQGKPDVALSHLQYALNQNAAQAPFVNALTLAETGSIDKAIISWEILAHEKDSLMQSIAESTKRVLGAPDDWFNDLTEKEKYQFLRYRVPLTDSVRFDRLLNQIKNEDFKATAILDRSKKWFAQDEILSALHTHQRLQGLHLTDTQLFANIKYFELRLFAARGQWSMLQEQIQKGILFGPYRETERIYYEALNQVFAGDSVHATTNFKWLALSNAYFDDGVVASAAFFKKNGRGNYSPYSILSEALQVNPNSIKILKAYIPTALAQGYDQYAVSSLQTLQSLISPEGLRKFVAENHLQGLLYQ